METLAAIIPRPAVTLLVYHGVLAPRARWPPQGVRYGRPAPDRPALEASPRAAGATAHAARRSPFRTGCFSIHIYARTPGRSASADLRPRMFSPLGGTGEDPATGSANGAVTRVRVGGRCALVMEGTLTV